MTGAPANGQRRVRLGVRVVAAATASGALAGGVAALTAVLAGGQQIERHADQRLRGAVDVLAGEIDEGFEEDGWEPLGEIVADENAELVTSGVRLAVYSSGHRIAGDPWVAPAQPGGCATFGVVGERARACGRAYRDWVLVAASRSDAAALRTIYLFAALGSLLAGALCGALASVGLTRWALRPLTALTAALRALRPDRAEPAELGPPSNCDEVELIREALAELLQRSQALLGQAQRFAADSAHELRTPLTAIRGELELLAEQAQSGERAALFRLCERTRDLGNLLERLLVLASPPDQRRARFEPVALADITAEAAAALPPEQRARVQLDLPREGLLRGDAALLRSLVANAIDNALKFSRDAIDVSLVEREANGGAPSALVLEVRDRGPGIPPAQRARVFEPFFRAQPDATPGHGLGLSIIGHIARAHGGEAVFTDNEGGALLRVTLPGLARPNEI